MAVAVVTLVSYLYYRSSERIMLLEKKAMMADYAATQIRRLERLHERFPRERTYPRDPRFRSAIYDVEYRQIFSTMRNNAVDFLRDIYRKYGVIHFVKLLDRYYLGAKYLFIEIPDDRRWVASTVRKIALGAGGSLLLLGILGWYLARLFVRPMRDSIELLDRFIKDTTHDLNTPLSTILANVEMIDPARLAPEDRKRFERIEGGARSVSTLYEDLKFATLESERPLQIEPFAMEELVQERLEFFEPLIRARGLRIHRDLEHAPIRADRQAMARVVDNLLSNAVKYNRPGGTVTVRVGPGILEVADTGRGMDPETLETLFERYRRGDDAEGGFGLGLDIVQRILRRHRFTIEVHSRKGEGSRFTIRWKES